MGTPFALELHIEENSLLLFLVNKSTEAQTYLYHSDLQPSVLIITDKDGKKIEAFDDRSLKKYDNTVYKNSFQTLEAGQGVVVEKANIQKSDSNYQLTWGPFQYQLSADGSPFRIMAEWESALDKAYDSESKSFEGMNVWKGKVSSNAVVLP